MAKGITPRSFAKKLRAFAGDIPKQTNLIKQEIYKEVALQIIGDTPRDTGQAASNWFAASGAPSTQVMYGPFSSKKRGGTRSGDAATNRITAFIGNVKPGENIFLSNNLPYIKRLNDGYSSQAPAGFVEAAVARGREILRRQRIRYKVG